MQNLNKIHIAIYFLLIFCFYLGCSNNAVKYYYSDKNKNDFYKIVYKKNKLISYYNYKVGNIMKIDSTIYFKGKAGYYENSYEPSKGLEYSLILSNKKDTLYNYRVAIAMFYCKISKLSNENFKSEFANYDSLDYKYHKSIFYDKNYNIYKIEAINNKVKTTYRLE